MNEPSYRVQRLETWPEADSRYRRADQFKSPWPHTLDLLERELSQMVARNIVLHLAVEPRDVNRDGKIKASARPRHPGVILTFDSRYGPLRYLTDRFEDWRANVRAIALSLRALRQVDRYGVSRSGEQYTGWRALPTTPRWMTKNEAERIIAMYGSEAEALKRSHPDNGGSIEDFKRVQEARSLLKSIGG